MMKFPSDLVAHANDRTGFGLNVADSNSSNAAGLNSDDLRQFDCEEVVQPQRTLLHSALCERPNSALQAPDSSKSASLGIGSTRALSIAAPLLPDNGGAEDWGNAEPKDDDQRSGEFGELGYCSPERHEHASMAIIAPDAGGAMHPPVLETQDVYNAVALPTPARFEEPWPTPPLPDEQAWRYYNSQTPSYAADQTVPALNFDSVFGSPMIGLELYPPTPVPAIAGRFPMGSHGFAAPNWMPPYAQVAPYGPRWPSRGSGDALYDNGQAAHWARAPYGLEVMQRASPRLQDGPRGNLEATAAAEAAPSQYVAEVVRPIPIKRVRTKGFRRPCAPAEAAFAKANLHTFSTSNDKALVNYDADANSDVSERKQKRNLRARARRREIKEAERRKDEEIVTLKATIRELRCVVRKLKTKNSILESVLRLTKASPSDDIKPAI